AQYLKRIKTGNGSVVIEYHWNASSKAEVSGTESVVEEEADRLDKSFAAAIANANALILGIKNRGVIPESKTYRKRLGLMREEGIICLSEIGFLTNIHDIKAYQAHKEELAEAHAKIIKHYEDLIV